MERLICKRGMKLIIDCEYNDFMAAKDQISLAQQLYNVYGANKALERPFNIHVSGITPGQLIAEKLNFFNAYQNWAMTFINHKSPKNASSLPS